MQMNARRVLVVSGQELVSQGLKLIIERSGETEVATAADESTAVDLIRELAPDIVVVDREEREGEETENPLERDYPDKVVVLTPGDDRMVVYSRQEVNSATLENLLGAIGEKGCKAKE